MNNGIKHLFVSALTVKGYCSFVGEVLNGFQRLYLLRGGGKPYKSLFLRMAGNGLADRGFKTEFYHRPEDHLSLEGVGVPELGMILLDDLCAGLTALRQPEKLQVAELDLGPEQPLSVSQPGEQKIEDEVMPYLLEAGRIWEGMQGHPPVSRPDSSWLLEQIPELKAQPTRIRRYFSGSISAGGPVSFIPHLTTFCRARYRISGSPGSGQGMMREILHQSLLRNIRVEVYHSYLQPDSLVLLLLPEIGIAVVDGSSCPELELWSDDRLLTVEGEEKAGNGDPRVAARLRELLTAAGSALLRRERSWNGKMDPQYQRVDRFVSELIRELAAC